MTHRTVDLTLAKAVLSFCPSTGIFTRTVKTSARCKVGQEAGRTRSDGYKLVCVGGREVFQHRLAWAWEFGEWPTGEIDHIDGNPSNNAISNLRHVTHAQNALNSRQRPVGMSGLRGVALHRPSGLWFAKCRHQGKVHYLGYFRDKHEAHKAYLAAVERLHGEHAFKNRPAHKSAHPKRFSLAGGAENG